MVTTVGTSNDLNTLITNYILLEHDAIAAYEVTIERLSRPEYKAKVSEFLEDHHRHLTELNEMAREYAVQAPPEGDTKQMLTTGKVKLADMTGGDGTILQAMSTNETDTVTAYERAMSNDAIPADRKPIFERASQDERRHKAWMDEAAERT